MELVTALKNIGFTQQEANLYIKLCETGELSGYEAAKLTGISRSNAYASLSSLADKGYANLIGGPTNKYIAVPKDELIQTVTRKFTDNITTIEKLLKYNTAKTEPYITVTQEKNVINQLKNIVLNAEKRIYISCNLTILEMLDKELLSISKKGLKLVVLSPKNLNSLKDTTTYYEIKKDDYFKIIADTSEVLAGTLDQALYSKNGTLVSIIRESFINEISLIEQGMNEN